MSKESTVLLWMLFKRVGQPAPHRKVCALEFDVTRSEVFPEVVGRSDNLGKNVRRTGMNGENFAHNAHAHNAHDAHAQCTHTMHTMHTHNAHTQCTHTMHTMHTMHTHNAHNAHTHTTRREANWDERGEFRRLPENPSKGWGELRRTAKWSFWQFCNGRRYSELDENVPRMAGPLS